MTGSDVIVVGLGGMGSAAAAHLSARGSRVLGLEQFVPAHDRGSSHGDSRMIRQAYYENPAYVPLLMRAYELWADLDRERPGLLTISGGLMMGADDAATVLGSLASARQWDLPHQVLSSAEIRKRFPTLSPGPETVAVLEERAGYVRPEESILAHLARADRAGADLRFQERVLGWQPTTSGVRVRTDRGHYDAGHLVLTAGAWAAQLLASLELPLQVERQLLYWFRPRDDIERYRSAAHPVFIWDVGTGLQLYGFPALGTVDDGVKVAFYRGAGTPADPDHLDRQIHQDEVELMRAQLAEHVPGLAGPFLRAVACMYTNTPDHDFIVSRHPHHAQVTFAAGFSGHGFKFAPVIGEILADLTIAGHTTHPVQMFSPQRFTGSGATPHSNGIH